MINALVHTISSRGEGLPYEPLTAGEAVSAPVSRSGIGHFRNRGTGDAVVGVRVPGPFGMMEAELTIPGGADRFVALSPRLSADGATIVFLPGGDLTDVDAVFFDRDILDRA